MRSTAAIVGALASLLAAGCSAAEESASLIVDTAPQYLRPYVLPKHSGQAVAVGQQIYRFSVTGNSSAGAFTLMQTNAPASSSLGVLPHTHKAHYENFYCTKGRVQLWTKTNTTGENARILTAGDYGAVPHDTIHTFQITDPDTQLTGVIQPGGFEQLFIAIGDGPYNSSTGAAFVPAAVNSSASGAGSSASMISALESFDVFAQLDYSPRYDFVNGSAGTSAGARWHDGANALAKDAHTPNFIAKGYGPKYLNVDDGVYRVVQPLVTDTQSAGNFTMGTITMSPLLANQTDTTQQNLTQPLAFQVEEGLLVVAVDGYDAVNLIQGDVVFIPAGTAFTYHAAVPFTKFLYVSGGGDGLDYQLLQKSVAWNYATYPTYAGYTI
ncbi:quercetin-dioxygenase [Diplodia corticola]|uniref:Quercetin-dioxygenase n=1 Tax=Diplodia corticola TaxID=236234 RepID=A0A1J9R5J2_9PEZI|nr:quercetin-dioxygenase [Diplodia corticola]OJD35825.1 quercetin-dioxygenase [Diplodia corticola]